MGFVALIEGVAFGGLGQLTTGLSEVLERDGFNRDYWSS